MNAETEGIRVNSSPQAEPGTTHNPAAGDHRHVNTLAAALRGHRRRAGLTQEELAHMTQLSVRGIANIEAGRVLRPHGHSLRKLAEALGLTQAEREEMERWRRQINEVGDAPARAGNPRGQTRPPVEAVLEMPSGEVGRPADHSPPHSIVPPSRPVPAQLPLDIPQFVGRATHLHELDCLLDSNAATSVCVITGMPGVGKTALAVRWGHRVRAEFPDGQLYVNLRGFDAATSPVASADVLLGFLEALGVAENRYRTSSPDLVGLYRTSMFGKRMLVLLDNAHDADQVRSLLPGASGSVTVVTSRYQLAGLVAVDGARPVLVEPCDLDEGRKILALRVGARRVREEPTAADGIVQLCARLPLALAIVGARAALHPTFSLPSLAAELCDAGNVLDELNGGEPLSDVRSVFSWSYRRLSERAARVLRVLGQHPRADLSIEAVASAVGWPKRQARIELSELVRAHLVTETVPGRFFIHDLIHAYARCLMAEIDPTSDQRETVARIRGHYLRTAQSAAFLLRPHRGLPQSPRPMDGVRPVPLADERQAVAWFTAEHRALSALLDTAAREGADTATWQLAAAMAAFLERRALWSELATAGTLGRVATQRLGDTAGYIDSLSMLGRARMRLGHYSVALECYETALRLADEHDDHAGQAAVHFDLALLNESEGRYAASLEHVTRARHFYQSIGNQAGEAFALNAMGWDHIQLQQPRSAVSYCEEAIVLHKKVGNHYGETATWDTLGLAHHLLGCHDEAINCFRNGLALVRGTGDRHLESLLLYRLGESCDAAGDPKAAQEAWHQALSMEDDMNHTDNGWAHRIRARLAASR